MTNSVSHAVEATEMLLSIFKEAGIENEDTKELEAFIEKESSKNDEN